jgi:hypothetical protein
MRKEAEGADDLQRVLRRQAVQYRFEVPPRRDVLVATEAHAVTADLLDGLENGFAALLADRVAKYPPRMSSRNGRSLSSVSRASDFIMAPVSCHRLADVPVQEPRLTGQ